MGTVSCISMALSQSVVDSLADSSHHSLDRWQIQRLKDQGKGCVHATDAHWRGLKPQEATARSCRHHLCTESACTAW